MDKKNRIFLYFAAILFLMSYIVVGEYSKMTRFGLGEYLFSFTFFFAFIFFRNTKLLKSTAKTLILAVLFSILLIALDVLGFWLVFSKTDYTQFILNLKPYYFIFSTLFILCLALVGCTIRD